MITARWLPREQEVRHAVRAVRRSRPLVRRRPVGLAGAVLVGVLVLVLLAFDLHWWSVLGAPIGMVLFGDFLADRQPWHADGRYRHAVAATLDEDGLRWTGVGLLRFDDGWPWTAFTGALETPDLFVLVGGQGFVPYLPKRALADPAAVRALLAEQLEVGSPRSGRRRGWAGP